MHRRSSHSFRRLFAPSRPPGERRPPDWVRLSLEELEERWLLTSYVVNSTLDILGDTISAQVTLRDAITAVNTQAPSGQAAAGSASNTITFAIPGSGQETISVGSGGF